MKISLKFGSPFIPSPEIQGLNFQQRDKILKKDWTYQLRILLQPTDKSLLDLQLTGGFEGQREVNQQEQRNQVCHGETDSAII